MLSTRIAFESEVISSHGRNVLDHIEVLCKKANTVRCTCTEIASNLVHIRIALRVLANCRGADASSSKQSHFTGLSLTSTTAGFDLADSIFFNLSERGKLMEA